jgi:hypothetical protein
VVTIQTGKGQTGAFPNPRIPSLISPLLDQPEIQVAVVEFDSHVRPVSGFTQDTTMLQKAFGELPAATAAPFLDESSDLKPNLGPMPTDESVFTQKC